MKTEQYQYQYVNPFKLSCPPGCPADDGPEVEIIRKVNNGIVREFIDRVQNKQVEPELA